ncbi:MAG: M56 family metallopeptidase [Fimbriimonadaceae bacterium]
MNLWSATMQAIPVMSLFAGAIGLLIWLVLALQKIGARGRMSLIYGLVIAGIFGGQIVNIVATLTFVPGPEMLKFGPSRSEISREVSESMGEIAKSSPGISGPEYVRAYAKEEAKYLPPQESQLVVIGAMMAGMGLLVIQIVRATKILGKCSDASERVLHILGEEDSRTKIGQECVLVLSSGTDVPWSFSIGRKIVLPVSAEKWRDEEVRLAIQHEVAHIREGHLFTAFGTSLLVCMGWIFPWMWFLPRAVRRLAEVAADEAVIEKGADRAVYAELLVSLGREKSSAPAGALPMVEKHGLIERVEGILSGRKPSLHWGKRGVWSGVAVATFIGLAIGLSARSFGMLLPVQVVQVNSILELNPKNNFQAKDKDGQLCEVLEMVQKRSGKVMKWTPALGWKIHTEELGLYTSSIESGNVLLTAKIAGWPTVESDRMYSLTNGNAVAWQGKVSTLIYERIVDKGITNLVYSRSPWKEVGKMMVGGVPEGRFKEFKNIRSLQTDGIDRLNEIQREFMVDYGQIMVPNTPPYEFGYDRKIIDRGATDRRVLFVMKNSRREVARQYEVDRGAETRELWRAHVDSKDVVGVVMEERPAMRLEISELPCKD